MKVLAVLSPHVGGIKLAGMIGHALGPGFELTAEHLAQDVAEQTLRSCTCRSPRPPTTCSTPTGWPCSNPPRSSSTPPAAR